MFASLNKLKKLASNIDSIYISDFALALGLNLIFGFVFISVLATIWLFIQEISL